MKKEETAKEQLLVLEKLLKKIIRKSIKDNTLDFTAQCTVSSLEPGKIKYAAQISSPNVGVQPIIYVFDNFNDLKHALIESETEINKESIELVFHQSRINTYKNKIEAHEARIKAIENGETDEADDIELEEV